MTSKLTIYNGALRDLGERTLSSLTENRESRRVLDDIWDTGFRDEVLSDGLWNFAMRTIQIEYTSSITPDFGFNRAFVKPSDWIRTAALSSEESFNTPLNAYSDEGAYWFADFDTIYVKFVSNDSTYGYDLSLWPINFVRYAQSVLALQAVDRLTQSRTKKGDLVALVDSRKNKALSVDAMNEPTRFMPSGLWSSSRRSGSSPRRRSGGWTSN